MMKAFFLRHKKLHLWLIVDLLALGLFYALRGQREWMNVFSQTVTAPMRRAIASLTYLTDVSMMEVLCVLLVLSGALYLLWSIQKIIQLTYK